MPNPIWSLKSVHLSGAVRPRLADVSVDVPDGVTAVMGPSGAGKTSLLNLLVGFERADAGEIIGPQFDETDANRLPLFWSPANFGLWPHLTVQQHLDVVKIHRFAVDVESAHTHGANAPCSPELARCSPELLDAFDLTDRADVRPAKLSQGECSRLAVARALASEATVLVMDEPLVHVDPGRIDGYWQVIAAHIRRTGASLLFSSHDPPTVLREAAHVICMKHGQVLHTGPTQSLYDMPPSAEVAEMFGPANWLTPTEAGQWLSPGTSISHRKCIRPERLRIEPTDDSDVVVESVRFGGALEEVSVRHERTESQRRFYHRPPRSILTPGMKVLLRISAMLLLCGGLLAGSSGCSESVAGPALVVQTVKHRSLPVEGMQLPAPRSMTVGPDDSLYVLDDAGRVLVYDSTGQLDRKWWMPAHSVGKPEGVCILHDGRVAVADTHYHRVVFFDQTGHVLGTLGQQGEGPSEFQWTVAVVQDDDGFLYVCEYGGNDRVQKFTAEGEYVLEFGGVGTEPGHFQRPSGMAFLGDELLVADAMNNRIQRFSKAGEFLGIVPVAEDSGGLHYPYDISVGPEETLFVVEYGAGRVTEMTIDGEILGRFGQEGRGLGQLWTPWGLATDSRRRVFVADTGNRRIVELDL